VVVLERSPIELVERFDLGKAIFADATICSVVAATEDLEFEQVNQKIAVLPLGIAGLTHEALVLAHHAR
jgi:hypothetical protein